MKILIFTEGTATMHSTAKDVSREERVRQSSEKTESVKNFHTYIPNGHVVEKLNTWKKQGIEIFYLTSRVTPAEINDVQFTLSKYHFPDAHNLLFRKKGQAYKDVAEALMPDLLIEDDCESIGGEVEMTYPHITPELKTKITSIVVKEFGGIDNLPDDLNQLLESSLKMELTQPIVGVCNDEVLHPVFCGQFTSYYNLLKQDRTNFTALVLSGLFLHLALESYLTWITRWLLKNVNRRKNRKLIKIWENHFENSVNLNKKFQFFADSFLTDTDIPKVREIKNFISKLAELRNKIVHGHEFSITRWSTGKVEKTKLAELLTIEKISDYYDGFRGCMGMMPGLFKKIDMDDITPGVPSKEWIVDYLTFKFKE